MALTAKERQELLSAWIKPSSPDEQEQQERAERMTRSAMSEWAELPSSSYRIYAKGSYANNTNVKRDSDVDIAVECTECFYYGGAEEWQRPDPYVGKWSREAWRPHIEEVMINRFGADQVDTTGSVAITIAAVQGSRPSIDIVPCFEYRYYQASQEPLIGSTVFKKNGSQVINWPHHQLEAGRFKQGQTGRRYKNFVRVLKNCENFLVEEEFISRKPSYLLECAVWNVPNDILKYGDSLDEGFKETIMWLTSNLGATEECSHWMEANDIKSLFGEDKPWSPQDIRDIIRHVCRLFNY